MAQSVRTLLDTVVQALPEVSNLGLLFFLLFFIFAALGVELFGRVGAYCWASSPRMHSIIAVNVAILYNISTSPNVTILNAFKI